MDYAQLDRDTLAHVDERYYYGAFCRKCKHRSRLSLTKLRDYLGPNYRLAKIVERLKCECCGSRAISVTFLSPGQMTGSRVRFIGEKPRG